MPSFPSREFASRRLLLLPLLFAASFGSFGCQTIHMLEVHPAQPIQAHDDAATVVFVRPESYPSCFHFTLVDVREEKAKREVHFLGEAGPRSHFVIAMPPGEHLFLAMAHGYADSVHANLAAGRVYVIAVTSGVMQGPRLHAATRSTRDQKIVHTWLDETRELVPEFESGQADLMKHPETIDDAMADASARWKGYDKDELAARVIAPEDGEP